MAESLPIFLKVTGEQFTVPYQLQTTISELINHVCSQTTVLSNTNPNDYYLAIDRNDILDRDRTVEETGLDKTDRFEILEICLKTSIMMKRISQSRSQFWQSSLEQRPDQAQKSTTKKISSQSERSSSFVNRQKTSLNDDEIHILICGSPKVGKSTLINALCGFPVAKTSTLGLDRCTEKTSCYQLDQIHFWDTPGIQEWSQLDINTYLNSLTQRQTPLCMFYCASPGSFTKLKQLDILLDECIHQQGIFCVLVVTNMFANASRHVILREFQTLLSKYLHHNQQPREEHGIWYYGDFGLCTMVNSEEYILEDDNRRLPQHGINELVLALIKSFGNTYQLDSWLQTIEKNWRFWLDNQQELYKLFRQ